MQTMAWSAENATKAYLRALKTKKKSSEPNVAEFISAMAAGSSARLMVEACASAAGPPTLALVAAAQQTGARVVCILTSYDDIHNSEAALGEDIQYVELVVGDATALLLKDYPGADFVLVDCGLKGHEEVFAAAEAGAARGGRGGVVVGYNALRDGMTWKGTRRVELLPIGEGLRVSRVAPRRTHQWVVRIDECTGEEHVFRVASPVAHRRGVEA